MRVFLPLLLVCIINCQSESLSKLNVRYISKEISCKNDDECFSKVDSLLEIGIKKGFSWSELSRTDSLIDFLDYASITEYTTILVIDNIESETNQEKLIRLGSDDGIRVFVNGEDIFQHAVGRGVQPDSDWIPISLKKGVNQLIFQVNQGFGNWALYYEIDDFENITNLFVEQAFELYRDLPEAYILSDEDSTIGLKIDPRTKLDRYNTISFSWKTPQGKTLNEASFLGSQLPNALDVPKYKSLLILEYEVKNTSKIIYSEQAPFFNQSFVTTTLPKVLQNNTLHPKWIEGVHSVFEQELLEEPTRYYSTRVKAEFLWDVLNELNPFAYQIAGARAELFNNELARRYIPQRPSGNKLVGMHLDFLESVQQYFDTNVGRVHFLMTQWNGYAQYYGTEFYFPFISNEIEEYSTNNVLDAYASTHSDSFSVVVWSKSTATIAHALQAKSYPITEVAVISPWVVDKPTENYLVLHNIFKNNPQLHWSIYRGENDREVTEQVVKEWMEMIEQAGMEYTFKPIPYTGHWVHWIEPLEFFLN